MQPFVVHLVVCRGRLVTDLVQKDQRMGYSDKDMVTQLPGVETHREVVIV